jgi:hypothetical protein
MSAMERAPLTFTRSLRIDPAVNARQSHLPALEIKKLATVAQPRGYPVDGQMDCLHHALVGITGPVTLQPSMFKRRKRS